MKKTDKKILIISHNPLSRVNNNGKTLASIFEGVPKENIYQIYLNSDIPDYSEECHYLQLNEKQILNSVIHLKNLCCKEVTPIPGVVHSATVRTGSFGIHTKRLMRESVWKLFFWKTKLGEWLKGEQFDVVFFMAGDGLFAYDVYRFVLTRVAVKGCLFFTDDYIIGKNSNSPVALLRRYLLKRKIRKTLKITKDLFVISEEMREAYRMIFNKDGCVLRNFSVEKKERDVDKKTSESADCLRMVYAGGLHYNRWKVLAQIASAIKEASDADKAKCKLEIYSSQNISDKIIKEISVEGASRFCGSASASQIADIYAGADILLHVESFDKKAVASTKYSFSTKIPEYLSAGRCIFAVGPSEVASIRYLAGFACVACDESSLTDALKKLISDGNYRESVRLNCEKNYEKDFSTRNQEECLNRILSVL